MNLVVAAVLDVTIVLVLALALMPLARRRSAALRHSVLAVAFVVGAVLPLVQPALPQWHLPVRMAPAAVDRSASLARSTTSAASSAVQSDRPLVGPVSSWIGAPAVLGAVWLAGAMAAVGVLLCGFLRLAAISRSARIVQDPRWRAQLPAVCEAFGLSRRVVLLESRDAPLLIVWGVLRPRVLLPAAAREWSDARIRLVLMHELAHVKRSDWIVQCLAEAVRVLHWFNPLVWYACARLRQEADRACDDLVLERGVEGPDYAAHLVDVARMLRRQRTKVPALAIAHTTGFERRVQAMLTPHIDRRPLSRTGLAITSAAWIVAAMPIAALTSSQTALVSFTGSVLDPTNAVLPGAVVTLTNDETQARYEVRTDRYGRFEIPGLPPGPYVLVTTLPGFQSVKLQLTVGGQDVQRDLQLELGTIQETITITSGPGAGPPREMTPEQKARVEEGLRKRAAQTCDQGPAAVPSVGGNIRVPWKLRDARPIYPAALATSGVGGTVVLLATIGTDGRVGDIAVESASHQEFAASTIEAVRQWEFDATLLNCVPVETRMTVTANFVHRP